MLAQSASGDCYSFVKDKGIFMETQRTANLSTSDIITGLLRDYDEYVERNLKRGYTTEQLNVGRTWKYRMKGKQEFKETASAISRKFKYHKQKIEGKNPPPVEGGVLHHSYGLIKACVLLSWDIVTFCCPCLQGKPVKK